MSRKSSLSLVALMALMTLLVGSTLPSGRAEDSKGDGIFNGKDLSGWRIFIPVKDRAKAKPEEVWTVKDGVIECKGRPNGYIITEKEYGDYILELEWRWPEKPGNSGVLLHVSGEDKVWPKSWEAQLFATRAGDIWLIDGYKLEVDKSRQDPKQARHYFRLETTKPVEKKPGEWNQYRITCKGDTVKLEINGQLVNEATKSERKMGKIALQSEGSPIHFRNIKLTPIR